MSGASIIMAWLPVCQCYGAFFGLPLAKPSTWKALYGYGTGITDKAGLQAFAASESATLTHVRGPIYRLDKTPTPDSSSAEVKGTQTP